MSARYLEFAMWLRQQMTIRDLSIQQLHFLLERKVPVMSIYQWFYGNRVPMPWQLKFMEQRLHAQVPYKFLMGNDRFGIQKKGRQLDLPGLREIKR